MKVLQLGKFYYPYMGGMENHLYQLCNELSGLVDLEVVVSNCRRRREQDTVDGVRVTRCSELAQIASTSICPALPLELSRRTYDVIHIHCPHPMGALGYVLSRKPRGHALVVTHHSDVIRQKRLAHAYGPLMRRILRRADVIVSTSPNYRDTSVELAPYVEKCVVVPYGIDVAQFARTAEVERRAADIRRRYEGPLLVAVGRHTRYKGFDYLIRAMKDIPGHLLLIGEGALRNEHEELALAIGVSGRVHFLGNIHNQEITPYYFAADMYVLPSVTRNEAFAIVQLEAMACGLPVINTTLDSGVPFVSRHGESGLSVVPGDASALAQAANLLIKDPALRRRMGEEGRRRVREEFSKELMTKSILELYSRAIAARGRSDEHVSEAANGVTTH